MFKKETSLHQNWLSKESADRVRALAELGASFLCRARLQKVPPPLPAATTLKTERVEEFTPFCAAASSNRALPTPSCFSERHLYHFVMWHKKQGQWRRRRGYERQSHWDESCRLKQTAVARLGACSSVANNSVFERRGGWRRGRCFCG